jgi:hypothetical protein
MTNQELNYDVEPLRELAALGGSFEWFGEKSEAKTGASTSAAKRIAPAAVVGPFGTLIATVGGRPFRYPFSADDVLWTARFLVGEAGGRDNLDNQAVIWAMLNRYALFTHRYYPTFHQFIRAYSTPLQQSSKVLPLLGGTCTSLSLSALVAPIQARTSPVVNSRAF